MGSSKPPRSTASQKSSAPFGGQEQPKGAESRIKLEILNPHEDGFAHFRITKEPLNPGERDVSRFEGTSDEEPDQHEVPDWLPSPGTHPDKWAADVAHKQELSRFWDANTAQLVSEFDAFLSKKEALIKKLLGEWGAELYRDVVMHHALSALSVLGKRQGVRSWYPNALQYIADLYDPRVESPEADAYQKGKPRKYLAQRLLPGDLEKASTIIARKKLDLLLAENVDKPLSMNLLTRILELVDRVYVQAPKLETAVPAAEPNEKDVAVATAAATRLTPQEVQARRNEVLEMSAQKMPLGDIPAFLGKKEHGEPDAFFRKHYAKYIVPGQEVIFAPDLKNFDMPLLVALRNRGKGMSLPLGTRTEKTEAISQGRFEDDEQSKRKALTALAHREFREKKKGAPPAG